MSEIISKDGMVGKIISIEELSQMISRYPTGGAVRPRTVARRLRQILELVERGPNGSLGKGATYKIVNLPAPLESIARSDTIDDEIKCDNDWLEQSIERMTRKKE